MGDKRATQRASQKIYQLDVNVVQHDWEKDFFSTLQSVQMARSRHVWRNDDDGLTPRTHQWP